MLLRCCTQHMLPVLPDPGPPIPPGCRSGRVPGPECDGGAVDAGRQRAHQCVDWRAGGLVL